MDSILIDDGYTTTRNIPGVPGLHPDLCIMYRPALTKERIIYRSRNSSADPSVIDLHEVELIGKFLVSINGKELKKEEVARLKPAVRAHIVDLILGYLPADEAKDQGNSSGG